LSVADFVLAYEAGELDHADPGISDLAGLLRSRQIGSRPA
jgi:hypothetical protein